MFRKILKLNIVSIVLSALIIAASVILCLPAPRAIALTTEILKPTTYFFYGSSTNDNPTYAYDGTTGGDSSTYNRLSVGNNNVDPTIEYYTWQTSYNEHSERRLYVRRSGTGNGGGPWRDHWSISYSTDGGTEYHIIEEQLSNPSIGNTSVIYIPNGLDLSELQVKIATTRVWGSNNGYADIYDVWLECDFTSFPLVGTQIGAEYPIVASPTTFTPQEEWATVTVPVWHGEALSHIDAVEVKVFYDSAGNDPSESGFSSNAQTCAVFTWIRGGSPEWDIELSGTTWAINGAGCSKPSDSFLQGNWVFSFKVGKVATYSGGGSDDWDIFAEATDYNSVTSSDYLRDIEMNWYGEVSASTVTVTWSDIVPGSDFSDSTKQTDVTVTYISNGPYYQKIAASTPWVGGGANALLNTGGTPGSMEFSLKADDIDNLGSAVLVTAYPTSISIYTGTQTSESGDEVSTNTIWLALGAILQTTYTGTIYYTVSNSP